MSNETMNVGENSNTTSQDCSQILENSKPSTQGKQEQSQDIDVGDNVCHEELGTDDNAAANIGLLGGVNDISESDSGGVSSADERIEKGSSVNTNNSNHENRWVNDGVTMLNKMVQDIVGGNENTLSQDRDKYLEDEVGMITEYELKEHIFSGWIAVELLDEAEAVAELNVLYRSNHVCTILATEFVDIQKIPDGMVALGFKLEVIEILKLINNHEEKDAPFDFEKLEVVHDNEKPVVFSEAIRTEKIHTDITTLKNNLNEYQLISNEFDPVFYEENYGSFYDTELDPLCHYLEKGFKALYRPNESFNTDVYLYRNIDVELAGCNPFFHFLKFGRDEGRRHDYSEMMYAEYREEDLKILAESFDAEFYWYTNPDMIGNEKVLDHYLSHGWREGRDPNPEFDTSYYLEYHPDVRSSGMNPFFHYLKFGKQEGRHTIRSRRVFAASAKPSIAGMPGYGEKTSGIVTSVVVMVKNEFDIIQSFASHLLALFDQIVFVDHNSKDGTLEFVESLAENDNCVSVFHLEEESYIQAVTMNFIVRELDIVKESDWVFLLDCDEFLPYQNRAELDRELASCNLHGVIHYHWKNLIPCTYWDYEAKIDSSTEFLVPDEPSIFGKIAFKTEVLNKSESIWIAQGNHSLLSQKDGEPLQHHEASEPLYHLPIRSINQLALKLNQGVVSYLKIGSNRNSLEGICLLYTSPSPRD